MSSPDCTDAVSARTIPVAPREIVDLITRLLRIHGVDPGSASDIATAVMHCQAVGQPAIEFVIDALAHDEAADIRAPHPSHEIDPESLDRAHRAGVSLDEPVLRALERAAADFLVAEHILDAAAVQPTVD